VRWPAEKAKAWGEKTPWLVGCNYGPATAINQLEMWQADTFDPRQIDKELGWAGSLGFNSARVFLHHLLAEQDQVGFLKRVSDDVVGVEADLLGHADAERGGAARLRAGGVDQAELHGGPPARGGRQEPVGRSNPSVVD
jgi:hypothetical protein